MAEQGAPSPPPLQFPSWAPVAGFIIGAITLFFLMGIIVASIFKYEVPQSSKFFVVSFLALGLALSFAFIGGSAAAKGELPVSLSYFNHKPLEFSVSGGVSVFVIIFVLSHFYFPVPPISITESDPIINGDFARPNPGNELIPDGWKESYWKSDTFRDCNGCFTWSFNEGRSGTRGLKISSHKAGHLTWFQENVKVKPNSKYILKAWVKTEDVEDLSSNSGNGANIAVMGLDEWNVSKGLFGTNDWNLISHEFNTKDKEKIDVWLQLGHFGSLTSGTVWFDDVSLTEIK